MTTSKKDHDRQFFADADCMLAQLNLELNQLRDALHKTTDVNRRKTSMVVAHKQELARMTIPNLEPKTIAVLKRDYPIFMTRTVMDFIESAFSASVPFWTWLTGGAKKFRQSEEVHRLTLMRTHFNSWLGIAPELPASLSGLADEHRELAQLQEKERSLSMQENTLVQQIAGIQRSQARYRSKNKPVPQELRDAMNRSSNAVRSTVPSHGGEHRTDSGGFNVFDYLILDSLLNPDRGERHDRRNEDDSFSHMGHRHEEPLSGGSFGVNTNRDDRDGGGGSFRIDTSNDDHDGGGGSFRTTTQPDLGNYS
ncbi:MAG: hypothetical protein AAB947_00490 [Patescibacteria group bacterium]